MSSPEAKPTASWPSPYRKRKEKFPILQIGKIRDIEENQPSASRRFPPLHFLSAPFPTGIPLQISICKFRAALSKRDHFEMAKPAQDQLPKTKLQIFWGCHSSFSLQPEQHLPRRSRIPPAVPASPGGSRETQPAAAVISAGRQLNLGATHPPRGPRARPGAGTDPSEEMKAVDNPTFNSHPSVMGRANTTPWLGASPHLLRCLGIFHSQMTYFSWEMDIKTSPAFLPSPGKPGSSLLPAGSRCILCRAGTMLGT